MAEIFDFREKRDSLFEDDYEDFEEPGGRQAQKNQTETPDYKKKILRHRLVIFYRILAVTGILAAIAAGVYINYRNMVYTDYTVLDTINYAEVTTANYLEFNNNILSKIIKILVKNNYRTYFLY